MPKRYQLNEAQISDLEALRKRNKDKNVEKRIRGLCYLKTIDETTRNKWFTKASAKNSIELLKMR